MFSGKLRFQDGTKAKACIQTVAFEFASDVSFKDSMIPVGKTRRNANVKYLPFSKQMHKKGDQGTRGQDTLREVK